MDFTLRIKRMIYLGIGLCIMLMSMSLAGNGYIKTQRPDIKQVIAIYPVKEVPYEIQ